MGYALQCVALIRRVRTGLTLDVSPGAIVWTEQGEVKVDDDGQATGNPIWPTLTLLASVRGETDEEGWAFSWSIISPASTEGGFTLSSSQGRQVTISNPTKKSTDWWTTGMIRCRATKDGRPTMVKDVPVALNALGTWKRTVVNDTATAVSLKKVTWTDTNGKTHTSTMQSAIQQSSESISLKVQDLVNGGIDASKPHTKVTIDFRSLDSNGYWPLLIRFQTDNDNDGGRPHTVEISRSLIYSYGVPSYATHSSGFTFRMVFSEVPMGCGARDRDLRIELMEQSYTKASDTCICPRIEQHLVSSVEVVWLRGGSKYDVTVDQTDVDISGVWPVMTQDGASTEPDVVVWDDVHSYSSWKTYKAEGMLSYSDGYYVNMVSTDAENTWVFGSVSVGNTVALIGKCNDCNKWMKASWHISSIDGSKLYVDESSFSLSEYTYNPLGIRMHNWIGYIKRGPSYNDSTWNSGSGFGTGENISASDVHCGGWRTLCNILVTGTEGNTSTGRKRAVLQAVSSYEKGSRVTFSDQGSSFLDVSEILDNSSVKNVKTNMLATGIDIKNHKIKLTADTTLVEANDGTQIAMFGKKANGMPYFNAALINAQEITVNRLIALDGDKMLSSVNFNGRGEFIQYYADGKRKMEIADGNIIYYNDDAKNSIKWIIGESGTTQSIDSWTKIELVSTNEAGSNVKSEGMLTGDTYSVFQAGENSTNAKYSGLTVKGTQNGTAPTATWLEKIPNGWYTNAGAAFFKANKNTSGMATGFATAARVLIKYEDGYKTGDIKQIEWPASADGGVLLDPNL